MRGAEEELGVSTWPARRRVMASGKPGDLRKKVKTALDETRLLILGAQVLFGFQLNGVFQEAFAGLSHGARLLNCAGQLLMAISIGLLIAPSMQHRIVEDGQDTNRILAVTTRFAGLALLPFGASLGISIYIVFEHLFGWTAALTAGVVFCILAGVCWYALEIMVKLLYGTDRMQEETEEPTPLSTKIEQLLTEARVIIPGAQALLGFQLTVTLTRAFEQLPASSRFIHVTALCAVALAVILLMTPPALHRISFAGEDTAAFFKLASWFVVAAPVPLAIGIAGDLYVASTKAAESSVLGTVLALVAFATLATLWYVLPLLIRARSKRPAI
jgi:Family of unknown function (DUF6328)